MQKLCAVQIGPCPPGCLGRGHAHNDRYLHFASHHPLSQKHALALTLLLRAERVCPYLTDRAQKVQHFRQALEDNEYPRHVIQHSRPRSSSCPPDGQVTTNPAATVVLPYVLRVSEPIRRILAPLDIRTCFCPNTYMYITLRHLEQGQRCHYVVQRREQYAASRAWTAQ